MLLLRYVFTYFIILVKAKTKGQYASWLSNITIDYDFWKTGFFNLRAI